MSNTDPKRYTIDFTPAARDQLSALAKRYKITQGEVIEMLLDGADPDRNPVLGARLTAKREQKVAARAAVAKLKNMPPEELALLLQKVGQ